MRKPFAIVAVLVAVGLGAWWWKGRAAPDADPLAAARTAIVDTGNVVAKVTATGTLSALVTVQVGSQVSGRIQDLYVDFNSPVKKGQVIARIDPQLVKAQLAQSKANHVAARGNLTYARTRAALATRQLERTRKLAAQKLVSEAELDTAETDAALAQAQADASEGQVAQTEAALELARVNVAFTTIYSPINGIVVSRDVDVGQTVAASLSAPTLFVIAEDLRKMQVNTSVSEGDVGRLKPGLDAAFTVDAFPGETFTGKVRQIRNAAKTEQNVVTYDAVLDVANADLKLRPGMTANVTFVVDERKDVLRVPNAALRFKPPERWIEGVSPSIDAPPVAEKGTQAVAPKKNVKRVWIVDAGKPRPVPLVAGLTDGAFTEVVESPLKAGDLLVLDAGAAAATTPAFNPLMPGPPRGGSGRGGNRPF